MDIAQIYPRERYLAQIRPFYHAADIMKVISGVRRCGKSCLMLSVMEELRRSGANSGQIVHIDLDSRPYHTVRTALAFDALLEERLARRHGKVYLFVDEVQNIEDFEPVLNSWRAEGDISIFVTGSNSYLLSGELVTKLTGRHIEFPMYPLTFDEYLLMRRFAGQPALSRSEAFSEYIRRGGFPGTLEFDTPEAQNLYVQSVVEQILEKDVRARQRIRNRDTFERLTAYVINNFGAATSVTALVRALSEHAGLQTKRETVRRYLQILENARVLEPCRRFDLKSRRSLGAQEKYYLADLGIYFSRSTDQRINYGPVLENLLYVYLRSRGYAVSVGKVGQLECDFIAQKHGSYAYVQVAMSISDPAVEEREYRVFRQIRDNYPQFLFTLDPLLQQRDGVKHLNLMDFMAEGRELVEA